MNASSSSLYGIMPIAAASFTVRGRAKPAKLRVEQRQQDLAHPVGAEVEAQHAVAVLHALVVADHRRQDELVVLVVRVGVRDDASAVGKRGASASTSAW